MILEHRARLGWKEADRKVYQGIFWRIWLEKKHALTSSLAGWYLGLFLLMAFGNPLLLLAYGCLIAIVLSSSLGGGDIVEDCEEFTFSLPPTRMDWFWTRFWTGLAPLLFMMIVGVVLIAWSVPQQLWGLVVDSGFTTPNPAPVLNWGSRYGLYAAIIIAPVSLYIFSFVLAAFSPVRSLARITFAHGILLTFTIYALGAYLEKNLFFQDINGWISHPLLLVADGLVLAYAVLRYPLKEGVTLTEVLPRAWKTLSVALAWTFAGMLWLLMLTQTIDF